MNDNTAEHWLSMPVFNSMSESDVYDFSLRATYPHISKISVYTGSASFSLEKRFSFDREDTNVSAVSYFIGAVLSSLMLTFRAFARSKSIDIEEMEGLVGVELAQPLNLIGVRGCQTPPSFTSLKFSIYFYADAPEQELEEVQQKTLSEDLLYTSLDACITKSTRFILSF